MFFSSRVLMNFSWALGVVCLCASLARGQAPGTAHKWAVVLHGGAGVIARDSMTPQAEALMTAVTPPDWA